MNLADLPFPQPLIGLSTPDSPLGMAIKAITHGPVEHALWLCSDRVTVCEAFYPRIHKRPLAVNESATTLLFALDGMTPELAAKLERFFEIAVNPNLVESYSVKGLFGFLLNVTPPDEQSVFCSEFVMQTIRKNAPALLPLARCEDYQVSPVDLYRSVRLVPVAWV
jgi:hypothetical protein